MSFRGVAFLLILSTFLMDHVHVRAINQEEVGGTISETTNSTIQTQEEEQNRIVGGEVPPVDAYPWFAAYSGCGGNLITSEFVLTAAHCVTRFRPGYVGQIRIGAFCGFYNPYGCNDPPSTEVITFRYDNIFIHPEYNTGTLSNDFALIKLDSSASAKPVKIDRGSLSPSYTNGKKLWAIGLGTLSYGGSLPDELRHVEVSYVNNEQCKYAYSSIDETMMCAADPGEDACNGDSGGPLYDAKSGVLVGVVSFGRGCAWSGYPGVYGRISEEFKWIAKVVCFNHEDESTKPFWCEGITAEPSSIPSSSPTFTPCSSDEMKVKLNVFTDYYYYDTSWEIIDTNTSEKLVQVPRYGYSERNKLYEHQYCFPTDRCLKFEIRDYWGNGISPPYGYNFTVDDALLATSYDDLNSNFGYDDFYDYYYDDDVNSEPGSNFGFSEYVRFGNGCGPTESPTVVPSTAPSSSPTFRICNDDEMKVRVNVLTDDTYWSQSWEIINLETGESLVAVPSYSERYKLYEHQYCFPPDSCLRFEIRDYYSNGISYPYGYNFSVDDVLLGTSYDDPNGNFGILESARFGDRCSEMDPFALKWFGWAPWTKLEVCAGDCDSDYDCAPGLICFHDGVPPNCIGSPYDIAADYCYDPEASARPSTSPAPSASPSQQPTLSPSIEPSNSPTLTPCNDDEMTIELDVFTDAFSSESSWSIIDAITGEELAGVERFDYSDFMVYNHRMCFPSNISCMMFEMKDIYGDGISEPYGYKFTVDGILVATSYDNNNGDFGYSESVLLGDGCPTTTPSTMPSVNCENDPSHLFVTKNKGERDCEWLSVNEKRQKKYCDKISGDNKEKNKFYCRESCRQFLNQCALPTAPPTMNPSQSPTLSMAPTIECVDNSTFTFKNGAKNCEDLYFVNKLNHDKFCSRSKVRDHCRNACGECCTNDDIFLFDGDKSCVDLETFDVDDQGRYCSSKSINRKCREACGSCDESSIAMPSMDPSTMILPCADDPIFTFKSGTKKCNDIYSFGFNNFDKFCSMPNIRENCKQACGTCCINDDVFQFGNGLYCSDLDSMVLDDVWYCSHSKKIQRKCRQSCGLCED